MFFATLQDGTNLTDLSSGSSSASTGPLPPYGGAPTPTGPENPVDLSSPRPVVGGAPPQPGQQHDPSRANGLLHPGANPALPDSTGESISSPSVLDIDSPMAKLSRLFREKRRRNAFCDARNHPVFCWSINV